jgi:hypothetical protein
VAKKETAETPLMKQHKTIAQKNPLFQSEKPTELPSYYNAPFFFLPRYVRDRLLPTR